MNAILIAAVLLGGAASPAQRQPVYQPPQPVCVALRCPTYQPPVAIAPLAHRHPTYQPPIRWRHHGRRLHHGRR